MALPIRERQYSVEEYLALDEHSPERLEYDGGYIYAMPGETGEHNDIVTNLLLALTPPARAKGCRIRHQNVKLQVSSHKYYYPDLMILCGPRPSDPRIETDPCLIAEVLSPTTAYRDRGQKLNAYLKLSTLERYLLISPEERLVGVYVRSREGWLYEPRDSGEIAIPCIEALLSLEAIYADLNLE